MLRCQVLAALVALPLLMPRPAAAQAADLTSVRDLLALCDATNVRLADIRLAQCNGFIAGTGLLYLRLLKAGVIKRWACAPEETGLDEARAAFVTWARGNPDRLDDDSTDGFWRAMAARWPCKKG